MATGLVVSYNSFLKLAMGRPIGPALSYIEGPALSFTEGFPL
jgi:hypothetical protein